MYVLYEIATGRAESQSSVPITNIKQGYAVKEVQDTTGIWNTKTLEFEPAPASKLRTTLEFMDLFTDAELVGVLDAAKQNSQIQLFVMRMEQASYIDLENRLTIDGVNSLELIGLIGPGRAEEILNG